MLSFIPLNINDVESVGRVIARVDKCNGYVFVKEIRLIIINNTTGQKQTASADDMFQCAMQVDSEWGYEQAVNIQGQYMNLHQGDIRKKK